MTYGAEAEKNQLIDRLLELVRGRWSGRDADHVEAFVGRYYQGVAPEDLLERPLEDLYGAAVSHWRLLHQDGPTPRIHAYNPDPEQNGWQSTHSIVQIVTDDMPFLVDSVAMALNARGLTIHLIIHPVIAVAREDGGCYTTVPESEAGGHAACMNFEVDRQPEPEMLRRLEAALAAVLEDVRLAVGDWQAMRSRLQAVAEELNAGAAPCDPVQMQEILAFLHWLADDHFTLLGYRCYDLVGNDGEDRLQHQPGSGLGILRHAPKRAISTSFAALPKEIQARARDPQPLIVTKSNSRATVHRPGYMDYVGVKRFDADGRVIGEHRFLGLYTSAAYSRSPRGIPLLREKLRHVLEEARLPARSHAGKALLHILETYPRDELFQIDPETLYQISMGVLHLQERQRTRLFVRYDTYRRFVSCLVYAPRERYNTEVRYQMQAILQKAFNGEQVEFSVQLSESVLARIHFIIRLPSADQPRYDQAGLEALLAQTMRSWQDDYAEALLEQFGEAAGTRLYNRYRHAFTAAYREDTNPRTAGHDTERLEKLCPERPLGISLYRPLEAVDGELRLKLYHSGRAIPLSEVLPMLENMGVQVLDERPYEVRPVGSDPHWVHDFGLEYHGAAEFDAEQVRETFQEALAATWDGQAEDDGFNRLALHARLPWPEITILRAYAKYLRQAGTTLSQAYIEATLASYPRIASLLVALFKARFDPAAADPVRAEALRGQIEEALNEVPGLDEDRILRRYLAALDATLRTNYFQGRGAGRPKPYLSFKLAPAQIPDVPQPHPAYEIFVYSPRFEGVHLRGGKVARGGLRWSDRREDFRTEVLGLMKAQMVKNAVIVPVGAKGGFVPKRLGGDREAQMAEVKLCYSDFIRGLLDITDNRVEGAVVPPPEVVRYDDDDPYLVVAADKGTASFSDLANSVAAEYGYWLKDGFASGGSTGYDHKRMGITARGGWEAVMRHFRELGVNIQREPFTAVGIGDMSGDVFGNGMLLSKQTRLVAAFDHRHIFIDPDPDPKLAYGERARLFALQRSSWADYDPGKLSAGGGIYPRSLKVIQLSEQARRALGVEREKFSPLELVRAILRAPVDLLWNGGIGTYVKAAGESNAEVGDKANDLLRVNGRELRCRVVGEGGNLGFTQRGRIEYALSGGRINTDAIDNSGGVDCSDHEVNIKILLNEVVDAGDLTEKQRNRLLAEMTDEVARLVLADNYQQTQALSLAEARGHELLDEHARLIRHLERAGALDRSLEFLPSEEELAERAAARKGLTRPELAVLLAYAKIAWFAQLAEDPLMDEPDLRPELMGYFPRPLQEGYPAAIDGHRLRREITATVVTNLLVNRMGVSFPYRASQKIGATAGEITRAFLAAREIYDLGQWWASTDALDNRVPAVVQSEILLRLVDLQERGTLWLLRNLRSPIAVADTAAALRSPVDALSQGLEEVLPEQAREDLAQQVERLESSGVPADLARRVAATDALFAALDIAWICRQTEQDLALTAGTYFWVAERLDLGWLRQAVDRFKSLDPWQERLRAGLEDEVYRQLGRLTADVLYATETGSAHERVDAWISRRTARLDRLRQTLAELKATAQLDLSMLAVAVQDLKELAQAATARTLEATGPGPDRVDDGA